jgi:hypothetical protein
LFTSYQLPATRHLQPSGLDLRSDGAGASFAGVVDAVEDGIAAERIEGDFIFSEFADLVG